MIALRRSNLFKIVIAFIVMIVIAVLSASLFARIFTGQWLGPRSLARYSFNVVLAVANQSWVSKPGQNDFTNIVFLHHSTGNNLIEQGGIRERLAQAGFSFWDHGYNYLGLRDATGQYMGYGYGVPNDNTDPVGLAQIFSQQEYGLPVNTLSGLLQHDVIILKSCFDPANHITTDQQLQTYKRWYLGMRDVMDRHPDRLFILMTSPPLNPAATNTQEAARAREFAEWLKSDEFLKEHPNISTFDLFGYLSEANADAADYGMLAERYRDGVDSHPNRLANETIAPLFTEFIVRVTADYRAKYASNY